MLITFSSNSSGDILMLEKHALLVLQAMGRHYETMPAEGVITHDQLSQSIANLEKAIAEDKKAHPPKNEYQEELEREERGEEKPHPIMEYVNLARRAFPLLEMMKKAQKDDKDQVVWNTGNAW